MLIRCSIFIALASQPFKLDRMIMQSSINQFLMETTSLVGPRLTLLLFKIIMLPLIVFMSPELQLRLHGETFTKLPISRNI